jgi:3-deoxy-D-arabino-heptulosonate 7-phosphate (DAHP) synthase
LAIDACSCDNADNTVACATAIVRTTAPDFHDDVFKPSTAYTW